MTPWFPIPSCETGLVARQDDDEEGEEGDKAAAAEEKEPPQETRIEVDVPKISTDLGKVRRPGFAPPVTWWIACDIAWRTSH